MIPHLFTTTLLALSAQGQHEQQPTTKPPTSSTALQSEINPSNLLSHLTALQSIADANGGNRAFGLPGYQASVDYIWSHISDIPGTVIYKQSFPGNFSWVESISLHITGVSNTTISPKVVGIEDTPSTPAGGISAELVLGPAGTAACNASSYSSLPVNIKNKIILLERGRCDDIGGSYGSKILIAAQAGAAAVIFYNSSPAEVLAAGLAVPGEGYVPAGVISQAEGQALVERLRSGEVIRVRFAQKQVQEVRMSENVFAEVTGGDSDSDRGSGSGSGSVVMLGAHLDSVQSSAGINDDGSGVSLILEVFKAAARYRTKNTLRFAWWGAEENMGVGSQFYCQNLTGFPGEADRILAYLNFDMVAKGTYYVGDGDGSDSDGLGGAPGSEVIERIWLDYFKQIGVPTEAGPLSGGSDYEHFMNILEKPVGILFTGAGAPDDACYHTPCDNITNIDIEMLTINTRAAAHMVAVLAENATNLIPRSPLSQTKKLLSLRGTELGYIAQQEKYL